MINADIFNTLFADTDYSHIAKNSNINLSLSAEETKIIYKTFDRGLKSLSPEEVELLEIVIAKIKDKLHP